jgi:class 3 adenylate cyclase
MRSVLSWVLLFSLFIGVLPVLGQTVRINQAGGGVELIKERDLRDGNAPVAGQGFDIPGIELLNEQKTRHWIGDDTAFAGRGFVDTTWSQLDGSQDSVVADATVHWVRYRFLAADDLKDLPLILNVQGRGAITLFLNGRPLVRSEPMPEVNGALLPLSDSIPRLSVPVLFLCNGEAEVLAIRIEGAPGRSLRSTALRVSLHSGDITYFMQRTMMHYGVFLGINVIILLLALVIGWSERGDRSWLLLALLSFVSVLDTLCDLGGDLGTMGLSSGTARALELFGTVLTPWSPYLLILVLGLLRGELSRKRARLYTIGVLVMTVICAMTSIADLMGIADTRNGLTFAELSSGIIITVVLCALIFGVIIVWFAIEVVRLGIQLLRSKGYERWVGAGAVASSLLTLALGISSQLTGFVLSSWLSVLADYCSYVAVPVSVAIYLAIRSVHHNRLVARQRDELDLEVKERTAELSAEKERSDELLLNILPAEVAEELKRTGEAAARHFDQASVLFTDFKGFTEMSEQVGAGELLQELNTCFKAFDEIIGARGVEKIKTIGDAYMCVGGLPDPRSSAPVDVVLAALEMQAFMKKRRLQRQAQDRPAFTMRVGIHTGPVVAGIVGVKKFQYDIWGDTVNIASRMESSGEVGQVNISEATYALVKDASTPLGTPAFTFTPRGKVQAKGKGEMEMYFVNMAEAVPS